MALYHIFGKTLVSQDELLSRVQSREPKLRSFGQGVREVGDRPRSTTSMIEPFQFSSGPVSISDIKENTPATGFTDVGVGKPAVVILRHVYTGRYPKDSGWLGAGRKDMLLTSAVRDVFATFNMAPRAVNLIKRRIPARTNIVGPDAPEDGTPLVFYSAAVTAQSTTITFDVAFDDFQEQLVEKIGSAVTSAGGIPVFGPYAGVLIAVGAAIRLASSLANSLIDARPEFSVTERLEFEVPGSPLPMSGFKLLASPTFDHTAYQFELRRGLVHKDTNEVFSGDEPYVIYLLDGKKNETFEKFTPTAASAALLSRFLSQKEGSEVLLESLVDAVKLYNDYKFRREADRLERRIQTLPADAPERKELERKRDAFLANIVEELLKPQAKLPAAA